MKKLLNKYGKETLIFAETIDQKAYDQVKELINSDIYKESNIRIMPDVHAGSGCTIGTTMTIHDKITPSLVGVDIGCGMLTVELKNKDFVSLKLIDEKIKEIIPSGFNINDEKKANFDFSKLKCKKHLNLDRAELSIGSLGGGNHFIEISQSMLTGQKYLIIHSGSRHLGSEVCKYYQNIAKNNVKKNDYKKIIEQLKSQGKEKEISSKLSELKNNNICTKDFVYLDGKYFDDYINDMKIIQKFASLNRNIIANTIIENTELIENYRFETIHNYIDTSRDPIILRKGAVSACKNEFLLIPINMSDGSLLCKGKGNPDWNYSAPHGAGRLMSRSKAKDIVDIDNFKESMKGIYTTSVGQSTIDEAPEVYKSINEIINQIDDTVEILAILTPIYNFKAH